VRAVEGEKGESVSFAGWAAGKLSIIHSRRQGGGLPGRLAFRRRQETRRQESEIRSSKPETGPHDRNGKRAQTGPHDRNGKRAPGHGQAWIDRALILSVKHRSCTLYEGYLAGLRQGNGPGFAGERGRRRVPESRSCSRFPGGGWEQRKWTVQGGSRQGVDGWMGPGPWGQTPGTDQRESSHTRQGRRLRLCDG